MLTTYDFAKLSPHDFELVIRDLAAYEFSVEFETFASGRDGGIDIRDADSRGIIIQCKHYLGTDFAGLKRAVKAEEAKVRRLKPTQYMVVTSRALTPPNTDELRELVDGWAPSVDVWGGSRIVDKLRTSTGIVERHPKLWMPSDEVLARLLNKPVYNRSEQFLQQAFEEIELFVSSEARKQAVEILREQRIIVITGDPGIGKTTLTKSIALEAAANHFEVILVMDSVDEAQGVLKRNRRQLFIFDDFLGQTKLLDIARKNESSDLSLFCDAIRRTPESRFIMTSRDYILNAALQRDSRLRRLADDASKITLTLSTYDELVRAKILYSHLYFSAIDRGSLHSFVEQQSYTDVIDHHHYNPRLIRQIVSLAERQSVEASEFPTFFVDAVDDPTDLWIDVFSHHLSDEERAILLALLLQSPTDVSALRKTWADVMVNLGLSTTPSSLALTSALHVLEPTFVKVAVFDHGQFARFANPGILDVVSSIAADNSDLAIATIEGVLNLAQLRRVHEWISPRGRPADYLPIEGLEGYLRSAVERALDSRPSDDLLSGLAIAIRLSDNLLSVQVRDKIVRYLELRELDDIGAFCVSVCEMTHDPDAIREMVTLVASRLVEAQPDLPLLQEGFLLNDSLPQEVRDTGLRATLTLEADNILRAELEAAVNAGSGASIDLDGVRDVANWLDVFLDDELLEKAEQSAWKPDPNRDDWQLDRADADDAGTDIDVLFGSL